MAQCPHCGGFKVKSDVTKVYKGNAISDVTPKMLGGVLLIIVIFAWVSWNVLLVQPLLGILAMLLSIGLIVLMINRLWTRFNLPDRQRFLCELCGYRWHLDPGDSTPAATVRPELIAKGERLLAEEQSRAAIAEAEAAEAAARQYALNKDYYYNVIRKQDK